MSKEQIANKSLTPVQQELLNRADSIMSSIGDAVNRGAEFVQGQMPDIALQYVAFGRAYETVSMLIALALLLVGLWLFINVACRNTFKLRDWDDDWAPGRVAAAIAGSISITVGLIAFAVNLKGFLLVWSAPKVWLILEIARLVR